MSYFTKYTFISPLSIYAIVKEELKSYFDTGAIDDLMFPTYTKKCLDKLGKSSYSIVPVLVYVDDFVADLPDNFHAVREAWLCTSIDLRPYTAANSFYSQTSDLLTVQVKPATINGEEYCVNPLCTDEDCTGDCVENLVQAVFKTQEQIPRSVQRQHLLKPGNIVLTTDSNCPYNSDSALYGKPAVSGAADWDSFDIRDNKLVTTFRNGWVELVMYATDYDKIGNQLVPNNFRIMEYIEKFLKYRMLETLTNQTNDETFNQLQQKMMLAKQEADEAYIMAEMEIKKQDVYTKQRRIRKLNNKFNKYELPTGLYNRRRNN